MGEDRNEEDDVNKLVKIGGSALLFSSVAGAVTVAVGRSAVAKRTYQDKATKGIDAKVMHEASDMAMKALGRATAYTVGTFGAAIGTACWYYDIWSLRDLRRHLRSVDGIRISKEGSKPTTWEDIFPEEETNKTTKPTSDQ